MSKDQVDWKKKYKEAAIELEKLESDTTADSLRSVLSHLVLGLQGNSAELDTELNSLKDKLHSDQNNAIPKTLVQNIETQIRNMDQSRDEALKDVTASILDWVKQLRTAIDSASQANRELAELERMVPDSVEKIYRLPLLIKQLLDLQSGVLAPSVYGDEEKQAVEHEALPAANSVVDIDLSLIGAELIQLIRILKLDNNAAKESRVLIKRIERELSIETLGDLISSVIELAQSSSQSTNEDFESYLVNLNSQLSEVQTFLQESHQEQSVAGEAHKQLDQQVRNDVSSIRHAVKNTHDLGELKMSVASQLAGIVRAMDEFKRGEEEREERLQIRYDALVTRVSEMEEETSRVKAHMEEEKLKARTDALTGLPNRAAYNDHMAKEFERWSRYQQGFSVAVGDLDFFKRINDNYGHLAGDKVLRLVAKVLSKSLRSSDFISRFGGEEFVILLPSTEVTEAKKAIEKLRKSICRSPFNFHGEPVTITMSFGVTQTQEGDTSESLFERADAALYTAKQNGRNQVCVG